MTATSSVNNILLQYQFPVFQMSSAMDSSERLEEEEVDDVEVDGLDEVVKILEAYLRDKSKVQILKDKLVNLGASNLSHIDLLRESDFSDLIPPIQFRQMLKDRKENSKENNKGGSHFFFHV